MHLDRLLADKTHRIAQLEFGTGHRCAAFGCRRVEFERCVVAHRARELKLHLHVGRAMPQSLEAADCDTELFARIHVLRGDGQRPVHHADCFRASGGNSDVDGVFKCRKTFRGNQLRGCVVKDHFRGTASVQGCVAARVDAGNLPLDQIQGYFVLRCRGHEEGVRLIPNANHAFRAAHQPAISAALRLGGADIEPIPRRALLAGQHHHRLAAGNARQPVVGQRLGCVAGQHRAGNQGLDQWFEHNATPQFLHHHHAFDRTHAQPTVRFRNIQATQPQVGKLAVSLA